MTRSRPVDPTVRTPKMMRLKALIAAPLLSAGLMLLATGATTPALAQQNLFAPRVIVNERVISNYELDQRIQFLRLLRSPGDIEKLALDGLIDDRLRLHAAETLEISVTPEQVTAGMEEFAGRSNLTSDKFIEVLAQSGIESQAFRDFVKAGMVWREVVRTKFGQISQISDAEVDRALAAASQKKDVKLLLSELILPAPEGREAEVLAQAEELQAQITTEAGFADAARAYSAAGSAPRGGQMDWLPMANLPSSITGMLLVLAPGEVSAPLPIPGGVALFLLRGIQETEIAESKTASVDYAQFLLPDDPAEVARVRAQVDTCDDLYGLAKGLPEERLQRDTKPMNEVPTDIALELARLDPGESSAALRRGAARVFLMLCARTPQSEEPISRDDVRAQLQNQRFTAFADGYLQELRANAIILEP